MSGIFTPLQWNKCLARVSLGMNSATSNLSSPSQQYPIKFASLECLNLPTPQASSYNQRNHPKSSHKRKIMYQAQYMNKIKQPEVPNPETSIPKCIQFFAKNSLKPKTKQLKQMH